MTIPTRRQMAKTAYLLRASGVDKSENLTELCEWLDRLANDDGVDAASFNSAIDLLIKSGAIPHLEVACWLVMITGVRRSI